LYDILCRNSTLISASHLFVSLLDNKNFFTAFPVQELLIQLSKKPK